ncbi:DeoR/GlpR family transcriptional regulator of sugar metabolism [Pullulanibacillus pueri]|uniref:DeoR family transcriptional regulator n=1 Tax=Pullulanibacillus pueri TaxID=1437324 RepID=A0A8J2ZXG6_9BACL|nr:DeoR/GlpR family DNA-binding transcription regulator [Pullulanibacillus pueri]MBM7682910.1 DeoR/GlpR family transcriptional regulator of sugar metabolism [Pullulanibacillus pueri]GGH84812.1 DeoR family transcriptional regulator [Pullulanibacillus pueri]
MIVIERRQKIKELLLKNNTVKVSDLVELLNVSEETIRRDLLQLEREGFAEKNYGGAILKEALQSNDSLILPVNQRKLQYSREKDLIGKAAAKLVQDDQIIILDAGSTTWYTGKHLAGRKDLTIISNAINVVEECSKNETASIYLLGGQLIRKSMSLVGPQAEMELQKYNADYVFLGTSGVSLRHGFTSSDLYEAEMKRAMVSAGQKIVLVADHSKFQKTGLTSFCGFEEIDICVTSDLVDKDTIQQIADKGVKVIITGH